MQFFVLIFWIRLVLYYWGYNRLRSRAVPVFSIIDCDIRESVMNPWDIFPLLIKESTSTMENSDGEQKREIQPEQEGDRQ